ncbi:hypothetical protein [Lacinutrix sp. Bg11-31]|uniref:hypothetical protein n=1 Tax=Lacinutrix sp. Bg11-31 TaxID=2057808 RepID=UPI000C3077D3|nr:hypothetical protein [Lacinutrix sp. Bg11-31]AUC82659.1 hypothetical protein CW733_11185 [Lacinutrix sp. Bg11-31]
MIKKIKLLPVILFVFVLITSCGSDDDGGGTAAVAPTPEPNTAPTAVGALTYPSSDLLCIDSTIEFTWSAATDVDGDTINYRLTIALDRNQTNIVEQITTTATSRTVTLQNGTAYYWNVVAFDSEDEATASQTFAFYTEGDGVSNHAPFAASLNAPALDAVFSAGTTTLDWSGSDVDASDTLTYDLYFGDTTDPAQVQLDVAASTFDVTTVAATTYYWRIDTKDNNGVKSIGQVWSFSTN